VQNEKQTLTEQFKTPCHYKMMYIHYNICTYQILTAFMLMH